ncbi:MAG: hypothetical protein KDK70_19260 [Myxococcales bacterium]|nr:hypothetical protein [Myxococcales bacterium]
MRPCSLVFGLAVLAGLVLTGTPAHAAPSANPDAKVRVHVDTDFFGVTHFNPQDNDAAGSNINVVGFGIGRPTFIDGSLLDANVFLINRPVLAFGVGGVLLGGRAVLGARAAFTVDGAIRRDVNNATFVAGRLVPYFNWMFNPAGRVRGFIGGRFGMGGAAITTDNDIAGTPVRGRFNSIYPIVGVQGGLHIFVVERVSLDPGLSFDYAAPHSRFRQLDPEPPPDTPVDDFDKDGDSINFAVTFGLSAWF